MFSIIILTASTLIHGYVLWRLQSLPVIQRYIPRKIFFGVFLGLWAISLVSRAFGHADLGPLSTGLEWFGMHWLGSMFIVFSTLLLTDLVTGFGYFVPRYASRIRTVALLVALGLVLLAFIQGMRSPVVEEYDIRLANLPPEQDGTVIVALSDLHVGTTLGPEWLSKRVEQVAALKPDYLFLLGDLVEGHGLGEDPTLLGPILSRFRATKGVFAVSGNHERHGSTALTLVANSGIRLLEDTWTSGSPGVVIAGIDDQTVGTAHSQKRNPFPAILAGKPEGA